MKQGIILVNKPEGWTSFDVVNYVRKIIANQQHLKPKQIKVGHSGTLDPFAKGLLILLIGKAYTKRAEDFSKKDKTYTFELILGKRSDTGDKTGQLLQVSSRQPNLEELEAVISSFRGEISQIPPAYSAIKIDGIRAYDLVRRGLKPNLKPRLVKISELIIEKYVYPRVQLQAKVSSGTYIRSLAEDIGIALKTGAYVDYLERTTIDNYSLKNAVSLKELNVSNIEQFISSV